MGQAGSRPCGLKRVIVTPAKPHPIQTHQLGPRYEGQLMSDDGAHSPFRSILLVLTHDYMYIITCVYGPTGSGGHEWVIPKRTLVAHYFCCRLWRRGCCTSRAPCDHLFAPQHELSPARGWRSTDRLLPRAA